MNDPLKRYINPIWSVAIILALPTFIFLSAEASFTWGCSTTLDKNGEFICANKVKLPGLKGIPFTEIVTALGVLGFGGVGFAVSKRNVPRPTIVETDSIPPEQE